MRSHSIGPRQLARGGVGTSTPARNVTGVRGGRPAAVNSTVSPDDRQVRACASDPESDGTLGAGDVGRQRRLDVCVPDVLFHDDAMTFQKNADVELGSPTLRANRRCSPVLPGSSTPGMV